MNYSKDDLIDKIIKENKIFRFNCELKHTVDEERKTQLISINNLLHGIKTTEENANQRLTELCNDLQESSIKKKWGKLIPIQKINKIVEYLDRTVTDKKVKNKLKKIASDMINEGKLKTSKDVICDPITYKIIEIPFFKKEIEKIKKKENSDEESD